MMMGTKNMQLVLNVLLGAAMTAAFVVVYLSIGQETNLYQETFHLRSTSHAGSCETTNETEMVLVHTSGTEILPSNTNEKTFEDLRPLLEKVAMDDNTIILTEVNEAWASPNSLLDLFLESFHIGEGMEHLLKHLVIVAMDQKAYEICQSVHPYCYLLKIESSNFTSEKVYMSKDFVELVWSKIKLLQYIVQLGYNVLFTDADVLWLRDPFKVIHVYDDLTLSSDIFFGNPESTDNFPNTGFFYVKRTKKNAEMLKYWYESRKQFPDLNEQSTFNEIKKNLSTIFQVKMRFVETELFGGFCNYGKDLNKIFTMHSNCCVFLENKLHDLRSILDDWKNYTGLPIEERMKGLVSWRVPGRCIH